MLDHRNLRVTSQNSHAGRTHRSVEKTWKCFGNTVLEELGFPCVTLGNCLNMLSLSFYVGEMGEALPIAQGSNRKLCIKMFCKQESPKLTSGTQ